MVEGNSEAAVDNAAETEFLKSIKVSRSIS